MSTTPKAPPPPDTPGAGRPSSPPEPITAVPVRHPGRWAASAAIVVLVAMFVHMLFTNEAFQWAFMLDHMFTSPVLIGVRTTLILTALSMVIGVLLGIVLALMRLSGNPVLALVSWTYTWFFRAVPRLVLAVLFGNLGILYATVDVGLPFDMYWMPLLGLEGSTTIFSVDARTFLSGFMAGLLALALSEGAYMAEIVRAGLQSVNRGQTEAAQALGMRHSQVMRRITLPQALRVIVPPTGNETVAMLKDTALVAFVPVTSELFFQIQAVGTRTFQVFPMLVAACIWYLAITSFFMLGQYFLEHSFTKGDRKSQAGAATIQSKAGN